MSSAARLHKLHTHAAVAFRRKEQHASRSSSMYLEAERAKEDQGGQRIRKGKDPDGQNKTMKMTRTTRTTMVTTVMTIGIRRMMLIEDSYPVV